MSHDLTRLSQITGIIRLSSEDQRRFVDLLLSPSPPSPALFRAQAAHKQLFGAK
jgi:hypothetical protein